MTELSAERGQTDFVMKVGDLAILELSGTLLVEERHVEPGEIQFWIERPEGKGGGFQVPEEHWGAAHWLPAPERTKALEIRMKKGHPVFSFQTQNVTV